MAKATRVVKAWSKEDEKTLVKLVKSGEPTSKIAKALKRTAASVRSKAQKQNLSLKPKAAKSKAKATGAKTTRTPAAAKKTRK